MKVTYRRTTTITIDLPLAPLHGRPAFHKADAEAWANRAHGRTTRLQAQVNATPEDKVAIEDSGWEFISAEGGADIGDPFADLPLPKAARETAGAEG